MHERFAGYGYQFPFISAPMTGIIGWALMLWDPIFSCCIIYFLISRLKPVNAAFWIDTAFLVSCPIRLYAVIDPKNDYRFLPGRFYTFYRGNAAYNASKAAVKSLTESLAYELRERPDSHVTAHLFIPGWTYTGLTGAHKDMAKPEGAWTPQETVLYMLDKVRAGDFYVLVPDNETRREVDELRIMWGAGDIVERRPALSRWHRDYKALFEEYVRDGLGMPSSEGSRSY